MKIIDEKGRLFGKINAIDFLAVLFLLCLTPVFFFAFKVFVKQPAPLVTSEIPKPDASEKVIIEKALMFRFCRLRPEIVKLIAVGDREISENGQVIGEILYFSMPSTQIYDIDVGAGEKIKIQDPAFEQMYVSLKIKTELKENSLYYKDKQISINSTIDFITDKYRVEAVYAPN